MRLKILELINNSLLCLEDIRDDSDYLDDDTMKAVMEDLESVQRNLENMRKSIRDEAL